MKTKIQWLNRHLRTRHHFTQAERRQCYKDHCVPGTDICPCVYCGQRVYLDTMVMAHEWSWSLFGPNALWNISPSHGKCNSKAGDKIMLPWQMCSVKTYIAAALILFAFATIIWILT